MDVRSDEADDEVNKQFGTDLDPDQTSFDSQIRYLTDEDEPCRVYVPGHGPRFQKINAEVQPPALEHTCLKISFFF